MDAPVSMLGCLVQRAEVDRAAITELGARRAGYVTRLSDYHAPEPLFEYLLTVKSSLQ